MVLRNAVVLTALLVLLTTHGKGEAGEGGAAEESAEVQSTQHGKLPEVIVSAQKRAEDLEKVPVSVQVIESAQLQEQNQNSLADLTRTLPGVHVSTGG